MGLPGGGFALLAAVALLCSLCPTCDGHGVHSGREMSPQELINHYCWQCQWAHWKHLDDSAHSAAGCLEAALDYLADKCDYCDMERSYAARQANNYCKITYLKAYDEGEYEDYRKKHGTPTQYYDKKKKKFVRRPGVYRDKKAKYWVVPELEKLANTGLFGKHRVKHSKKRYR